MLTHLMTGLALRFVVRPWSLMADASLAAGAAVPAYQPVINIPGHSHLQIHGTTHIRHV